MASPPETGSPNQREPRLSARDPDESGSPLARVLAALAVVAAIVVVALLMFTGSNRYDVSAVFQNAGQLVKGNLVEVGGRGVGKVTDISLTDNGQALVKMQLDGDFAPLHEGTRATLRANSLAGIANRYIALQPAPNDAPTIPDGGTIRADQTGTPVDLDQIFDTLDPKTRQGLQQVIRGSATQFKGKAAKANESLRYLNPALSTSSRVTSELVRDQAEFQRFVIDTSGLVTTLAGRRNDLSQLVGNANATTRAIGDENVALARALGILPGTLRKANTTFVNLRSTLDDLDPLVAASGPATKRLAPFLAQLRPLVRDAQPTIRDLRFLIRSRGPGNDLIDLTRKTPRLEALSRTVFPRAVKTLRRAQPVVEYIRPYSPDFAGWLTKFGQGANPYDANGHYARIQPLFNAFQFSDTPGGSVLTANPPSQRLGGFQTRRSQRCPGGAIQPPPDGSAPYREPQTTCDPSTAPPGP